jgi:cytochrome c-type biogenesis protein CcmF
MNLGNILLWLSALAMIGAIAAYVRGRGNGDMTWADRLTYAHALLLTLALGELLYLFLSGAYQYDYVNGHSSRSLEFFYKISAVWAGQEGTFLLWAWIVAVLGLVVMRRGGELKRWGMIYLLATQAFLLILMFVKSPFAFVAAGSDVADGHGLNPLLKDPWMVIHPPIVFLGYAAFTVPYIYTLAALTRRKFETLATTIFPWVAFATCTLGAGIFIGGFWAYKVLGWGGYWGWDPVENASLVPWLVGMASLHSLVLYRSRGQMPKTSMWLAAVCYLLVVYGTFLTRSGVLSDFSVHSFADVGINAYLSGYLLIVAGGWVVMFLMRGSRITAPPVPKAVSSREFGLVTGVLLFLVAAAFVIVGTSSPILTKLWGPAANVTTAYYNQVALPVGIFIALVLGFSPFLLVERTQWNELFRAALWSVLAAVVVTGAAIVFASLKPLHLLLIFVSVLALVSNLVAMIRFSHGRPLRMAGHLTHFGFAIMVIGVIASAAYGSDETLTLSANQAKPVAGVELLFRGQVEGATQEEGYVDLRLIRGADTTLARPRLYTSEYTNEVMRTPYIKKGFLSDLYIAPMDVSNAGPRRPNRLTIHKGETVAYSGWQITFQRYDMSGHGEGGSMVVGAVLEATKDGKTVNFTPLMEKGAQGQRVQPTLMPGTDLLFTLGGMSVEEKSVTFDIEDPAVPFSSSDVSLVVSVSRKPLTSFVWIGCVLITLGSGLSYWRRRKEEKILLAMNPANNPQ